MDNRLARAKRSHGGRVWTLTSQDAFLSENDVKSELSHAYIHALAVNGGYAYQPGPQPDRISVDAVIVSGEKSKPQMDLQLKAASSPRIREDGLHFRLGAKNYNDLRELPRRNPIILAVLELPPNRDDWLDCDGEGLTMRRRAWWLSLAGYPETDAETQTVILPHSQLLTPNSLTDLMTRAREWGPLSRSL